MTINKRDLALGLLGGFGILTAGYFYWSKAGLNSLPTTPASSLKYVFDANSSVTWRGVTAFSDILVEFGDYQCPPCAAAAPYLSHLMEGKNPRFGFQFRNFPLSIHPLSGLAAKCAAYAGTDFWTVHDKLYSLDAKFTKGDLEKILAQEHLSPKEKMLADNRLKLDAADVKQLHLQATPTFFYYDAKGKRLYGPLNFEQVKYLLGHI